jgi:hypothetical protein
MRTQALAVVVALFALNASSGLTSEDGYDGRLAAVPSATATDFASAARSDRVPSQAPETRGEAAVSAKRPLPDPMMFRVATLGTDRV